MPHSPFPLGENVLAVYYYLVDLDVDHDTFSDGASRLLTTG